MKEPSTGNLNTPWYHIWIKVLVKPTKKTFDEIKDNQNLETRTAFKWLITSIVLGTIGHFVFFILFSGKNPNEYPPVMSFIKFLFQLLIQTFFLLISRLMIITLIQHVISKMLGGSGKYSKLFLVTSSFLSPVMIIFAWIGEIPYLKLMAFPLLLFEFYLHILAIKSVNSFSWAKAIGITITTIFISGILLIGITIIGMLTGISIIINSPFINTSIP